MRWPGSSFHFAVLAALSLAGCGDNEVTARAPDEDPALTAALVEPIMIDIDLAGQNRANSAAAMPSQDGFLPALDANPEAIAAARDEALRLVGGAGRMQRARAAAEVEGSIPAEAALTATSRAAAVSGIDAHCVETAQYTMLWAAKMPRPFPVYPRAAVQEAAGSDSGECSLRVANFITPVPLAEVIDFYFTRADGAGFSATHTLQNGDDVLAGRKGAASYAVYARRLPSGNTEVDLVTSGG